MPKAAKGKSGKPKKAPSAFLLWSNDHRDAVKKENSALTFGEVGKALGNKWKEVTQSEKERYEQRAAELKIEWQKNMAAWNAEHGDEESDSGKKKGAKGKRAKKDPNAPKGATNAYMVFSKAERAKMKAEGKKLTFAEAGQAIAAKWKSLSDDDKKPFAEAAEADKKRHEKEMDAYKKSGGGGKAEKPAAAKKAAAKKEDSSSESDEKESDSDDEEEDDDSDE